MQWEKASKCVMKDLWYLYTEGVIEFEFVCLFLFLFQTVTRLFTATR